jgi:transposase InsO family protein
VSKARLVITAVVVEGCSQSAVAREYGVSQGWISRLVKRYRLEGDAAFEPRSRRPHRSPSRLPQSTIDLIVELRATLASKGLDHGPQTIAWHLRHHHQLVVSVNSIHRHLRAAGEPDVGGFGPFLRSWGDQAAEQPNERWQADFTHWWLADTTHVDILNWLDDHARYALSVTAHRRVTGPIVVETFREAVDTYANTESRALDYLRYSVNTWLVRIETALGRLLPRQQYAKLNAGGLLRSTTKERYEAHEIALRAGFLTVDEVRALEDLPPLPVSNETGQEVIA